MLSFKDLKPNFVVYLFDKQTLEFERGNVTAVSMPRIDGNMTSNFQTPARMVVDVTINSTNNSGVYSIPENSSFAEVKNGNLILAIDVQNIVAEISAMKNSSEQVLKSTEHHQKVVEKTSALLVELNPVYKEKRETEERFNKLEGSIANLSNTLEKFINEFKS